MRIVKKFVLLFVIICFIFAIGSKKLLSKKGFVSVKGSAEKIVKADMAYWTIAFSNSHNILVSLKDKNKNDLKYVIEFLKKYGLSDTELKVNPLELIDLDSREYKDPNQKNRYFLTQSVSVITDKVDIVEEASQNLDLLIDNNVSIKGSYGENRPMYKFTKINSIKQELLHEATLSAKKTAEQFAKDSDSKVGNIKYANQGVININAKNKGLDFNNESFEKEKEIRSVITIEYWLE